MQQVIVNALLDDVRSAVASALTLELYPHFREFGYDEEKADVIYEFIRDEFDVLMEVAALKFPQYFTEDAITELVINHLAEYNHLGGFYQVDEETGYLISSQTVTDYIKDFLDDWFVVAEEHITNALNSDDEGETA